MGIKRQVNVRLDDNESALFDDVSGLVLARLGVELSQAQLLVAGLSALREKLNALPTWRPEIPPAADQRMPPPASQATQVDGPGPKRGRPRSQPQSKASASKK